MQLASPSLQGEPAQPARQPAWPGGPALPPSFEGGNQRCFRNMFVCINGMRGSGLPVYSYGQHVVQFYKPLGAPSAPAAAAAAAAGGGTIASTPATNAGAGAADASCEARVLRIVFQKRGEGHPGRAILNIQELLQRCNAWQYKTRSGRPVRAACLEVLQAAMHCMCCWQLATMSPDLLCRMSTLLPLLSCRLTMPCPPAAAPDATCPPCAG